MKPIYLLQRAFSDNSPNATITAWRKKPTRKQIADIAFIDKNEAEKLLDGIAPDSANCMKEVRLGTEGFALVCIMPGEILYHC